MNGVYLCQVIDSVYTRDIMTDALEVFEEDVFAEAVSALESDVEDYIKTRNTSSLIFPIIVTLLLILLGGYLMKRHSLITSNRRSFVICGLQGSGKTNLFHLLTTGKLPTLTVSTLEPKSGELLLNEELARHTTFQDLEIMDFPANSKLKNLYLVPYLTDKLVEIQGIIYILDSSNFDTKICHQVAEDLFQILNITEGKQSGVDILIFANKNDLFTSKKTNKIKEMLESEIGKIHELKLRGLSQVDTSINGQSEGNEEDDNLDIAAKDGKFQFQLLDGNVEFAEGNIFKNKYDKITNWLYEKIVN